MTEFHQFVEFVEKILKQKDMSRADLARKSGLDTGTLSNILNYERGIGPKKVLAIAIGLEIEPEDAFRKMGWLPGKVEKDPREKRLTYLFNRLASSDKDELIEIAELKLKYKISRTTADELDALLQAIPSGHDGNVKLSVVLDWLKSIGIDAKEIR